VSKMPEALLIAGRLLEAERYTQGARVATQVRAAAKLRRLHAVNAEMLKALRVAVLALAHANESAPGLYDDAYNKVSAAIAKAEEVKP